jgi:hypothetical protein
MRGVLATTRCRTSNDDSVVGLLLTVPEFLNNLWRLGTEYRIGLSYRPARLNSLAELVSWNQFLGSLKV